MRSLRDAIHVLEEALRETAEGISIADARQSGFPLVFVNRAFYEMTGYTRPEVMGRNCQFLQGKDTNPETVEEIRQALQGQRRCVTEILNYTKEGQPFWNRLSLVPIFDNKGELTYYVGIQSDITKAREATIAEEKLKALQATMHTVNDIVRNFMNVMLVFRETLAEELPDSPELVASFDDVFATTLKKLDRVQAMPVYREKLYGRVLTVLDVEHEDEGEGMERNSAKTDK